MHSHDVGEILSGESVRPPAPDEIQQLLKRAQRMATGLRPRKRMHQSALLSSRCLHQNEGTITPFISVLDAALSGCGVTQTTEMSTRNSANKLWRRRDVIKLLAATAIAGPMIFRGTPPNATSSKEIKIGHLNSSPVTFT